MWTDGYGVSTGACLLSVFTGRVLVYCLGVLSDFTVLAC